MLGGFNFTGWTIETAFKYRIAAWRSQTVLALYSTRLAIANRLYTTLPKFGKQVSVRFFALSQVLPVSQAISITARLPRLQN